MNRFFTSISRQLRKPAAALLVAIFVGSVGYVSIHSSFGLNDEATENIIVRYKAGVNGQAVVNDIAATPGVKVPQAGEIPALNMKIVGVASSERDQIIAKLEADPNIMYAEPDYIHHNNATPNDTLYSQQWQWPKIKMDTAWDKTKGVGVVVAVIDSGLNMTHPDLVGKFVPGTDLYDKDNDPTDEGEHGTWVGGTIAAATNNGEGVAGGCWDCKIMPIKNQGAGGSFPSSYSIEGVQWAADHGVDVINISSGGSDPQQSFQDAINYAVSKGVIVIASAGNDGSDAKMYPAAYDNVIAVAGTDKNDLRAANSNYGSWTDLAAPYTVTTTQNPGTSYSNVSGTSFSAPIVSAAAAILISAYPNATVQQLTDALTKTTDPCCNNQVPNGRLNVSKALDYMATLYPGGDNKPGDLDANGKVNLTDLSKLLSAWNTSDPTADLNKSGKVDLTDLSMLLSNWTG